MGEGEGCGAVSVVELTDAVWVGLHVDACMTGGCESEDEWCACVGIEEWQCIVMWCVGMW